MSMGLICCYSEVDERIAEPASWFEEVSRLDLGLSGGLRVFWILEHDGAEQRERAVPRDR